MESKIVSFFLIFSLFLIIPSPRITSINPGYGLSNGTVDVVIEGEKIDNNAIIKLVKPGETDIVATNIKTISKKQIGCSFDLRGRGTGEWNVIVANISKLAKKAKTDTLVDGFTIRYPAPAISAVEPTSGLNSEIVTVNFTGANFRAGAKVELCAGDRNIQATEVKVHSDTQISAGFNLVGSVPGTYDLKVINDDGIHAVLAGGFGIMVKPVIHSIVPTEGFNNGSILAKINGAHFQSGTLVKLVGPGRVEIAGLNIKIKNSREITCFFDLNKKPNGRYDVVVLNPDGQESSLLGGFRVNKFIQTDNELNGLPKPIVFDYNKSEIRPDQIPTLEEDLKFLNKNPNSYILLGGHTDERGSREYNLQLSKRRAGAIKEFLLEKGMNSSRISIYVYGKDYPAKKGHDESSWRYNRRVDILVWESPPTKEQGLIRIENPNQGDK